MTDERSSLAEEPTAEPPSDFRRAAHAWFYPSGRIPTPEELAAAEEAALRAAAPPPEPAKPRPKPRVRAKRPAAPIAPPVAEEPAIAEAAATAGEPAIAETAAVEEGPAVAEEAAVAEVPSAEDAAVAEEPSAEEPAIAEAATVAEEPAGAEETSVSEEPAIAEAAAVAEEPAGAEETSVSEEPAIAEQPSAEQPSAEQPSAEQSSADKAPAEEPALAAEPPAAEPPASEPTGAARPAAPRPPRKKRAAPVAAPPAPLEFKVAWPTVAAEAVSEPVREDLGEGEFAVAESAEDDFGEGELAIEDFAREPAELVAAPALPAGAPAVAPAPVVDLVRIHLRGVLEALIFASTEPVNARDLARLAKADLKVVKELLAELHELYQHHGFRLDEVAGGYAFRTSPAFSPFVRELVAKKPVRMSRAQLETLAIIAYRQPITRPEIDDVRGVDSGAVMKSLLERGLLRILGKKEDVGRPMLYGTTADFLTFFGLKALADLPTLREFTELSDESRRTYERELGEDAPEEGVPGAMGGLAGSEGDLAVKATPPRQEDFEDADPADTSFAASEPANANDTEPETEMASETDAADESPPEEEVAPPAAGDEEDDDDEEEDDDDEEEDDDDDEDEDDEDDDDDDDEDEDDDE